MRAARLKSDPLLPARDSYQLAGRISTDKRACGDKGQLPDCRQHGSCDFPDQPKLRCGQW
jgi:hypothetical protein